MAIANNKNNMDKRINQRIPYSGPIFFVAENGFNEGTLKNYSRSGLFINTKAPISMGEIITIALPYLKNAQMKCRGQILRRTIEGFGIELFRNRNGENLKVIK